jgi:hypothetical protein
MLLSGCAQQKLTLEELEREALVTGDWSKVEKREKSLERERIAKERREFCAALKMIVLCIDRQPCFCASRDDIYNRF